MRAPRLFNAILAGAVAMGGVALMPSTGEAYTYSGIPRMAGRSGH